MAEVMKYDRLAAITANPQWLEVPAQLKQDGIDLIKAVRRLMQFEKAWRDLKADFEKESGTGCHYSTDEIVNIMAQANPEGRRG